MGLSPSVNAGHITSCCAVMVFVFCHTSPLQFARDSLEEEHSAPPRRVRGKRSSGERRDHVVAPLPPPAEAPHPEGFVLVVEEGSV